LQTQCHLKQRNYVGNQTKPSFAAKFRRAKIQPMTEKLFIPQTSDRIKIYDETVPQIAALVEGETDLIANLANITAALKEALGFFWVGFYIVKENQLVLSAFQGSIACTRIDFGKGVCGHCYTKRQTVIVRDVEEFPGHIACSSLSKSEIVLPIFNKNGEVAMVLDVDSDKANDFSEADAEGLQMIVKIVEKLIQFSPVT
jgi:GAF domain-containing protein